MVCSQVLVQAYLSGLGSAPQPGVAQYKDEGYKQQTTKIMASIILTVRISEDAKGDNIYNLLDTIKMGCFSSSGPEFMYKITHSQYNSFMNAYSELNKLEQSFLNIRMI